MCRSTKSFIFRYLTELLESTINRANCKVSFSDIHKFSYPNKYHRRYTVKHPKSTTIQLGLVHAETYQIYLHDPTNIHWNSATDARVNIQEFQIQSM